MAEIIKDGTGSGDTLKITAKNRAVVEAIITSKEEERSSDGDGYILSSGLINLTSACESALLFILNNECVDLVVDRMVILTGDSTCGADTEGGFNIVVNPTAGTLVDCGSCGTQRNTNFGSTDTLCIVFKQGAEARTLTDGANGAGIAHTDINQTHVLSFTLPKGKSIGIKFTPPTGNMGLNVIINLFVYKNGSDI
jgi:hypothetical protein